MNESFLSVDFETRSAVDLARTGVYPYAIDKMTDVLCMAYAFVEGDVQLWAPGDAVPGDVVEWVKKDRPLRAWNANFERLIWWAILGPRYGFPTPKREQWYDTAADAAALALPRALNRAALALGLPEEKDDEGYRLMRRMSKPRKPLKGEKAPKDALLWHESREDLERLYAYCKQDVRVERAIFNRIRPIGDFERRVWLLDSRINDRGVAVDRELVQACRKIVDEGLERANDELAALTKGEVSKVTKVKDLTVWLQAAGLDIEDVRKDTVRDLLTGEDPLTEDLRRVLEIRQEAAKSSTAKLKSMLEYLCPDLRARGMLLYHGAGTGRWAGKGPQPQNYPRPSVKKVERFVDRILAGEYDLVEVEEPALVVVSSLLRSCFRAAPGTRFLSGDYSQIEARIVAWFAQQEDMLKLFMDGGKVYETMAAAIYRTTVDEILNPSEERQVGKTSVLGCGFGMGADTFATQTRIQTGIVLDRGEFVLEDGVKVWKREDMAQRVINTYRSLCPLVPLLWKSVEGAAIQATQHPGQVCYCGRNGNVRYVRRGQFLWCILPSGRPLAYARPEVRERLVVPKDGREPWMSTSLSFMGVNGLTNRWERQWAYGGLLTENIVQATARDLMATAMLKLEEEGYPVVLTVHDEVLCEVPGGKGSLPGYLDLMRLKPSWATGLPVAVEGWEGERYRK